MASAASADENVTIDGIDFNVPDGFTEDLDEAIVNETDTDNGMTYISNGKCYDNKDDVITIVVCNYQGVNVSEDVFSKIDGANLKIKDVDGKLMNFGFLKVYCYVKDGKLVTISTNNQDNLEKFII